MTHYLMRSDLVLYSYYIAVPVIVVAIVHVSAIVFVCAMFDHDDSYVVLTYLLYVVFVLDDEDVAVVVVTLHVVG